MKDNGKIIQFDIQGLKNVRMTHGYDISNAFPIHFHSSFSLGIVEEGCREFLYRGEWVRLMPNDIFVIQPLEPHCCKSPDGKHSYKIISFDDDRQLFYPHLNIQNVNFLSEIRNFHQTAERNPSWPELKQQFEHILSELHPYAVQKADSDDDLHRRMNQAKTLIETNCLREVSLKEMADAVCLSEFYFNRLFHQCYGLSPYTYYLIAKIKQSQRVLRQANSIVEAGYDVGFFDQSHFTKEFKRQVGVTPGKFLRDNL